MSKGGPKESSAAARRNEAKAVARQALITGLGGPGAIAFFIVLVAAAATLAVGLATALGNSEPAVMRELQEYSDLVIRQAVFNLRQQLETYESITFQFVANQDLNEMLRRHVRAEDVYEVATRNVTFSNYLEGYAFGSEGIFDAFFLDESNVRRKALTMREYLPASFIDSFRSSQTYRDILEADGKPVWSVPVRPRQSGPECVTLGRRVKHLFSGRPLGVLVLLIRASSLSQAVGDYLTSNFYFSVGTVKAAYITIVDSRGRLISTPRVGSGGSGAGITVAEATGTARSAQNAFTDVAWNLACLSQPRGVLTDSGSKGSFVANLGNERVLTVYHPVEGTDWHVFVPISPRTGLALSATGLVSAHTAAPLTSVVMVVVSLILTGVVIQTRVRRAGRLAATSDPGNNQPAGLENAPQDTFTDDRAADGGTPEECPERALIATLSSKERAILALISQGCSNREIAKKMFVAEQTVKNYVSVIYDKIGVRDRVQASLLAARAGLAGGDGAPARQEDGKQALLPRGPGQGLP